MISIATNAEAVAAYETADDLIADVAGGSFGEARAAKEMTKASELLDAVMAYYHANDNAYGIAKVTDSLGFKARHVDDNPAEAATHFQKAADIFAALDKQGERLAALIELGEMRPSHAEARRVAYDAIARGLLYPIDDTVDPRRLAAEIARSGDVEAAIDLYQAMITDALNQGQKSRAAMLSRDVARIYGDGCQDKRKATEMLEICLAYAEDAEDKAEIGAALLRLADIWSERGNRKLSCGYFDRVANMRGLPGWQQRQISTLKMVYG